MYPPLSSPDPSSLRPIGPQGSIASQSSSYFFVQTIGNATNWKYKDRTVMLVDERTINAGEEGRAVFRGG